MAILACVFLAEAVSNADLLRNIEKRGIQMMRVNILEASEKDK